MDHKERHVSVSESELNEARDDLVVQHFISNGYFIQSSIESVKKEIFDPETRQRIIHRNEFEIGDKYRIVSSDCELEVIRTEPKIELKYTNRDKNNLLTSAEQVRKVVSLEYWKKL